MKANRRALPPLLSAIFVASLLVTGCSDHRIIPAPTPTRAAHPQPPLPSPPPQRTPSADWRDAPITPGEWSWSTEAGGSVARFAGDSLTLRCNRAAGTVALARSGANADTLTIVTTSTTRTVAATPLTGASPTLAVSLRASDSLLDAMAFSRGRFAIEAPGLAPLYLPSWPELSRVIEDCR